MSDKTNVLFLCTGNSARSQMAEALLRHLAGDRYEVRSAGLEPKGINPYARAVLEEKGLDISRQRSKHLSEYMDQNLGGYLITVCGNADERCPYYPGQGTRLHWPFDDPAAFEGSEEETLAVFRATRDALEARILAWLAEQKASNSSAWG